jgi:hypothetical protein
VNVGEPLATMLVKVTGFEPVEVFFTVTVAFAVEFTTIPLNVTLEGVKLRVGAAAAAPGAFISISRPASSATKQPQLFTAGGMGRSLWAMELELIAVSANAKSRTLRPIQFS